MPYRTITSKLNIPGRSKNIQSIHHDQSNRLFPLFQLNHFIAFHAPAIPHDANHASCRGFPQDLEDLMGFLNHPLVVGSNMDFCFTIFWVPRTKPVACWLNLWSMFPTSKTLKNDRTKAFWKRNLQRFGGWVNLISSFVQAGNVIKYDRKHMWRNKILAQLKIKLWLKKNPWPWSAKQFEQKIIVKRLLLVTQCLPECPPSVSQPRCFCIFSCCFNTKKTQGSALSQREPGSLRMGGSYKVAISGGRNEILDSKWFKNPSLSIWLWKVHPGWFKQFQGLTFDVLLPKISSAT